MKKRNIYGDIWNWVTKGSYPPYYILYFQYLVQSLVPSLINICWMNERKRMVDSLAYRQWLASEEILFCRRDILLLTLTYLFNWIVHSTDISWVSTLYQNLPDIVSGNTKINKTWPRRFYSLVREIDMYTNICNAVW